MDEICSSNDQRHQDQGLSERKGEKRNLDEEGEAQIQHLPLMISEEIAASLKEQSAASLLPVPQATRDFILTVSVNPQTTQRALRFQSIFPGLMYRASLDSCQRNPNCASQLQRVHRRDSKLVLGALRPRLNSNSGVVLVRYLFDIKLERNVQQLFDEMPDKDVKKLFAEMTKTACLLPFDVELEVVGTIAAVGDSTLGSIVPAIGAGGFAAATTATRFVAGFVAVVASFGAAEAGLTGVRWLQELEVLWSLS
ncbi:putative transmembrane protein [Sesbania bispinosa]|nr:putative transmembrane protein [Sesbania bispinosa]